MNLGVWTSDSSSVEVKGWTSDASEIPSPWQLLCSDTWQRLLAHQTSGCRSCEKDFLTMSLPFLQEFIIWGHLHSLNLKPRNGGIETLSL